jgi:hypothetical protein
MPDELPKGESGTVFLLLYLFPGLLGSFVYDFLAEGRKRENFERIVGALALTLVTSVTLTFFGLPLLPVRLEENTPLSDVIEGFIGRNLLYGSLLAVGIGTALACLNNWGTTFDLFQFLGITNKTSSVDVWADTFGTYRGRWVRLRFQDGVTLVGWTRFYSQFGDAREMFLSDASWTRTQEDGTVAEEVVAGPGVYVADFSKVIAIEVLDGV